MAADDIAAVNLPPIMPTGDGPPHDSRRGGDEKKRVKNSVKNRSSSENQERQGSDQEAPPGPQPQPEGRDRKPPNSDIDFERPEHELDKFA